MRTVSLHLDDRLEAFVDQKVRSGQFDDQAAVVRRALDEMQRQDAKLEALKAQIQEGLDELDAGLGIEVDDIEAWLDGLGR